MITVDYMIEVSESTDEAYAIALIEAAMDNLHKDSKAYALLQKAIIEVPLG